MRIDPGIAICSMRAARAEGVVPQFAQRRLSGAPPFSQNFAARLFACRHPGHCMEAPRDRG